MIREQAEFLYGLLDDIDTANDQAKDDDAFFRKLVNSLHGKRFEVASTDGYSVFFKGEPGYVEQRRNYVTMAYVTLKDGTQQEFQVTSAAYSDEFFSVSLIDGTRLMWRLSDLQGSRTAHVPFNPSVHR